MEMAMIAEIEGSFDVLAAANGGRDERTGAAASLCQQGTSLWRSLSDEMGGKENWQSACPFSSAIPKRSPGSRAS